MLGIKARATATAVLVSTVVLGLHAQPARSPGAPWLGLPGLERLTLSEEQRAALKDVFDDHRESGRALFTEMQALETKLQQALFAENAATLDEVTGELAEAQKAALKARVSLQQRIIQLLTPEQRQQLAELSVAAVERRRPAPRRQ